MYAAPRDRTLGQFYSLFRSQGQWSPEEKTSPSGSSSGARSAEALAPPKGPLGSAVAYALNHWTELTRFIENPGIPPDNNRSESALRVVALGRKNFLFVGHEQAGQNLAGLYSLVATCTANGKDPLAYLTDVLTRLVNGHLQSRLGELTPWGWKAQNASA